jgi:hypothetical protein
MVTTLNTLMNDLIKDPDTTNEQLVFFEERLWKNQTLSESKSWRSLVFSFVTLTVWFIIKSTTLDKLSFLGMEFTQLSIPLLVLPPISAFFYYRFHCENTLNGFITEVLREYYSQKLKPFEKRNLTDLLKTPTFYNFETTLTNIADDTSSLLYKTTKMWRNIIEIIVLFIPILLMLWMLYSMLTSPIIGILWSVASSALVLILIVRSLLIFIYGMKLEVLTLG